MYIKKIFDDFSKTFVKKIENDYFIKLQFEFSDLKNNNIWQIDIKDGKISIYNEERIVPEEIFILTVDTLEKLYKNELSPLTAFANEPNKEGIMCSLIDLKNKTQEKIVKLNEKMKQEKLNFINRLHKFHDFFSKDYPGKIIVKNKNCIKLHNVNGIGLFSDFEKGILHAFFSIKTNEVLKQPPIEFSILVLHGKGILRIDNEEYPIEKNEYYHLNPHAYVFFENKNDESLDILYLGMKKIIVD